MASRTLIRSTNWIGDAVLSLAAIREVRRLFPDDHLTLAALPWVAALFQDQGAVDAILALDPDAGWNRSRTWRKLRGSVDRAIVFPNSFRSALECRMTGAPERIGYRTDGRGILLTRRPLPRFRARGHHHIYYYLDLLHSAGLSPLDYLNAGDDFTPDISLSALPQWKESARALLAEAGTGLPGGTGCRPVGCESLVLIHPGAAYGSAKRWFPERYAEVADRLIESLGCRIALIGSASEIALAERVRQGMRHRPAVLTGKTDLPTLMGLIATCSLFISNDSGPMHLAAALGVRQVSLFGSTDEIATGPFNPRAVVIHKHVECSPCLLRECPLDLRCFDRIRAEEVASAAEDLLKHGP